MIDRENIKDFVLNEIEQEKIILVEIQVNNSNVIKIIIDSLSGVTIDQCAKISRFVESKLDRDIEDFELEVSSYGISQPFILPLHYQKNLDKMVEIYMKNGKSIKGKLKSVDFEDDEIKNIEVLEKKKKLIEGKKRKIEVEEIIKLSGDEIHKAKLQFDF